MGVELRLENGLTGTIFNKDISSTEEVQDPTSRIKLDQVITGRITRINYERHYGMRYNIYRIKHLLIFKNLFFEKIICNN